MLLGWLLLDATLMVDTLGSATESTMWLATSSVRPHDAPCFKVGLVRFTCSWLLVFSVGHV